MGKPVLYDDDGGERELPVRYEICDQCQGSGTSSAYLGAFTRDELWDQGEEWVEDYVKGRFDRACETCGGRRVIEVVDRKKLSKADRKAWNEQCEEERSDRETSRMERLMEGGWREEGWYGND
jgi:hypothetical protein